MCPNAFGAWITEGAHEVPCPLLSLLIISSGCTFQSDHSSAVDDPLMVVDVSDGVGLTPKNCSTLSVAKGVTLIIMQNGRLAFMPPQQTTLSLER